MKKRIAALFLVLLLVTLIPCPFRSSGTIDLPSGLQVHFLDVGQGDCAVILCDGESMVIDGGPKDASRYVYSYIRDTLRLSRIDCIVSTHPHADHVYGLASVLNAVPADLLLTPVLEWDSWSFNAMMKYANRQGTAVSVPQEGDSLRIGGAKITILHCWPEAVTLDRANDASIVLRIDYGSTSFLFTGDAEDWSEYMMIDAKSPLKADVLKVSHHGSGTASTAAFLKAVSPRYAVISSGRGNDFGHPHNMVLNRLQRLNCKIFRTDELGTIVFHSDGKTSPLSDP